MKKSKKMGLFCLIFTIIMASLVGCAAENSVEPAQDQETPEEVVNLTTDIVIIGAGGAGLAAAIEAKDAGQEVIIVEKMPMVGGNTLRATGGLNAAETGVQEALGIEDTIESYYEDTMTGGYDKNDPQLVKTMTENAADAVDWLIGLGADLSDVGRMAGASQNRSHRPAGGAAAGPHIVKVLKENAEEREIEILTETTVIEILEEAGQITGIVAVDKNNQEFTIEAKAVIVATGGFGANTTMFEELDPSLTGFGTTNHPGATGDGIAMATEVGAALVDMEEIQTHPTVVPENGYMITEAVRGNGAILVNHEGVRFVDELQTRDVVSEAILEQESQTAFLFFDEGVRESLSAIEGYVNQGLTQEANTLEELAVLLEMDPATLTATIEAYNDAVSAGSDEAFGRSDLPRALETGKYYVIEIAPAVHHTMGGLKINTSTQVLNEAGEVISGLYAAGEVVGGVHGGNRLGGNALADIVVFGRLAGQTAAADLEQ